MENLHFLNVVQRFLLITGKSFISPPPSSFLQDGFSGFACQECKNPKAFGKNCDKECDCQRGVCNKGPDGDGQCLCQPPYTGRRCDEVSKKCSTCSPFSYCKGDGDEAECDCLPGYRKSSQKKCLAFCSQSECDINAACSLRGSKIKCVCKPGYEGDGRICIPRNPCLENNGGCPFNSTVCVFKGPNKVRVPLTARTQSNPCPEFGCSLLSACSPDSCGPTAVCQTQLDGKPRCVCEPTQIGDGHHCYGNLMERLIELDSSGSQRANLTGAVALFESGCVRLLSHSGPFTVFVPILKTPLKVSQPSESVCKNHLILGQHLYMQMEGLDFTLYGGGKMRLKPNRVRDLLYTTDLISFQKDCEYVSILSGRLIKGCAKYCNTTTQCCQGFFGPDCRPCIGGFQHPCYDKGTCFDGIHGNGSCSCHSRFKGVACHICSDQSKHGENCDEDCLCVHGVCDNRPGSGGGCRRGSCLEGYSGENCDKKAMPCNADGLLQHCHIHAFCTQAGLETRCVCKDGFDGNGHFCTPINLCLKSTRGGCDTNADCVYVGPGNVSCVCMEGWTGDGRVCVEINNCKVDGGGCSQDAICTHIGPGQNECVCKTGYVGNGKECELINPCSQNNGGCHELAKCEQKEGGVHTCTCPDGYVGDGSVCYGSLFDVSLQMLCAPHSFFAFVLGRLHAKFSWIYDIAPLGSFCFFLPVWVCIHHVCVIVGCVQILAPPSSDLPPEPPTLMAFLNTSSNFTLFRQSALSLLFLGLLCLQSSDVFRYHVIPKELLHLDHLHDGLQSTTLLGADYQVQFHLNNRNQVPAKLTRLKRWLSHQLLFGLVSCSCVLLQIRPQFPPKMKSNCRFRKRIGSRRKFVPGCVMECLRFTTDHSCCPGYYGHECFKCPGDIGSVCSNHGKCLDGIHGNGECQCFEGFHGTACEDCEPGRYGVNCSSKCVCANGKCDDGLAGSGKCMCHKGWKGTSCSVEIKDDACGGVCDDNANCVTGPNGLAAACVCVAGYEGNGTHCKEMDLCSRSNGGCSEFAICTKVSAGERTCSCKEGYTGDGVVCLEIDGCLVNNGGCHKAADCTRAGPNIVRNAVLQNNKNGGCSNYARCEYLGQGKRNCTCLIGHIGDGFDCRGTIINMIGSNSVLSKGPLTVFIPLKKNNKNITVNLRRHKDLVFNHVISCESLSLSDLRTTERAVAVSGQTLHFSLLEVNTNTHTLTQQVTDIKQVKDIKYNLVAEDAGLLPVLQMNTHQPFTMFWPTDKALASLPAERQQWLSSPDHLEQLAATVKAHVVLSKLTGINQPTKFSSYRTMHGSTIKFSCDKNLVGSVLINDNSAKLVERHLTFKEGVAYGIDQLLEPPGLGAFCDTAINRTTYGRCGNCFFPPSCPPTHVYTSCRRFKYSYRKSYSGWYGDLDGRFGQSGCRRICQYSPWVPQCCKNHYGRDCQVCPGGLEAPCSNHGLCNDGRTGSGSCMCYRGFKGKACDSCVAGYYGANCTACSCENQGRCDDGMEGTGTCVCSPGWEGKNCQKKLAPDLCSEYNGGCHQDADCNQTGLAVNCTCHEGYQGDGFSCQPINRWCTEEQNGGCSEFATCKFTGPNKRECECLQGYVGNGVQCLEKVVPPVDRCQEDNGGCAPVASCKDLHYHANTAGVFHLSSPEGKYKMNFSQANTACQAEGATLATYKQLADAQQLGMHLCVAGWIKGQRVGYVTQYPSPKCGDNHVGVVLYKDPVDVSNKYDAYCYRLQDVSCACPDDYIGNGVFCHSVLTSVLSTYSNFSLFYKVSEDHCCEFIEGPLSFFLANCLSYKMVNQRLLLKWDIPAVNGIIHVIEAPLTSPILPVSQIQFDADSSLFF
uniref:Stabilin 1 n=1 Tax=Oryzias sinensis TaxID=183150 RepID=A0A8C8DBY5_9TELE